MRFASLLLFLSLTGCGLGDSAGGTSSPPELSARPLLESAADSLAWRITEAAGGLDAWHALPRLRFDFVVVRDTAEGFRARHLWDRASGRYRIEYPAGPDSTVVALFDVKRFDPAAPAGDVYINGSPPDSATTSERLVEAHTRYINDTYWLLAPLKLFDPGVRRSLAPDSVSAGTDVLKLSFENVGLTPGDQYWLTANPEGQITHWSYALEGGGSGFYAYEDYAPLPTPQGNLLLSTRKQAPGRAILTPIHSSEGLPEDVFTHPTPVL